MISVLVHLEQKSAGHRVHHRDAHAVESAGDLVTASAELSSGVQHGQSHLGARLRLVLRVRVGGNASPVVGNPAAAVGQQGHVDAGAVPCHGLVDRVVDQLPHAVVEAAEAGRPDVHPGSFPDRLEALEDHDLLGSVLALRGLFVAPRRGLFAGFVGRALHGHARAS